MISHTEERKHICEICNKAFKSINILKVHIRSKHAEFVCDICGKEYKSKQSFDRHLADHQGKLDDPTKQCNICLKWFSANYIYRHAMVHKKVNVNCNKCGKNFQTKTALWSHMDYKHKPKKEYSCTFCDKKFVRSSYLKEHINRHTGEKFYHCRYCSRSFLSKSNMYGHVKKMHLELWKEKKSKNNQETDGLRQEMVLCCLCLYQLSSVELFSNGEESNVTKLIAKYMHEMYPKIYLSQKICQQCYQHLIDFHNFYQLVEERRKEYGVQNGFLEVNCVLTNSIRESSQNVNNEEQNEERLLDMKDIIAIEDANLDKLLPQEFAFADDEINLDNGQDDRCILAEKDEDDLPLQILFPNEYPLSTKKTDSNKQNYKVPQNSKCMKTVRKGTRKRSKATTTRKKHLKTKGTSKTSNTKGTLTKQACSGGPEDNKSRNEIISKNIRLKCELCDFADFKDFKDLRTHFRREHDSRGFISCCGKRFYRRFALIDHIKLHLDPEHFKCKLCNKVLKSKVCLDIHHDNMHAEKCGLRHPCTQCRRRFAHLSNLTAHMLSHKVDKNHLCEICKKAFKSNYMLKVHIRTMHGQRVPYICDTCGKEYKFKPSFQRHLAEHKGKLYEPTEQCSVCGKWLKSNGLKRHMDGHNMNDVECKICGKRLKSKAALTGHIEYNHKKTHDYACTFCDKTFKKPCVLKEHMAMHTGRKDYNCQYCEREFRSKANMYAHVKKTHVEQWMQARLNRNKMPSENNLEVSK